MIALIQRVNWAQVDIAGSTHVRIGAGLLAFIGMEKGDGEAQLKPLLDKLLSYRVFADDEGKMNLSLRNRGGELLLVSQFTLAADTGRGLRPSFSSALAPSEASKLWRKLVDYAAEQYDAVSSGEFGADMQVSLQNNGPVTFWLQVN